MPKTSVFARRWLLPLLLYCSLTSALTWPLITQWTTHLPGGTHKDGLEDGYQNVWNLWWMAQAFTSGQNPLVTDRLFYPEQPHLYYHTLSPINTLLAVPVTLVWGPIAAFNAVAFASFVVAALGAWCLALDRTRSQAGAILAGFVYAWSPFHLAALVEDGQLQIFSLHWLPWYVLFALRSVETGGRRNIGLAALFLALTAWTDWYYTLFLLLWTAGYGLWQVVRAPDWVSRQQVVRRLLAIGGLFGLGAAPLLVPMLVEATRANYMNLYPASDPQRLSADVLAYAMPARLHPWWGAAPWRWNVAAAVNRRLYLGVVAACLALYGWRTRAARPWAAMLLGFGLLSLGPTLQINGIVTGIPLPYRLIGGLPIIRLSRQPDRFAVLVTLALAVLVAYGVARLLVTWPRTWRIAGAGVLLALLLIDYLPAPIHTFQPTIPAFFAQLPAAGGALLEYPFHADVPYRDAERMLFQTVHGRPISGGYHSRLYPQPQLGLPVLRDLAIGQIDSDVVVQPGGWRAALQSLGYAYIIGYKQQLNGPRNLDPAQAAAFRALVQRGLAVEQPDYEDDWLIAYQVPSADPAPLVGIRAGWGSVETTPGGARYRWLATDATLTLVTPTAGTYALAFIAQPAAAARSLNLAWDGGSATLALAAGVRRYTILLNLPAGSTVAEFHAVEPPTSGDALESNGDQRPISIQLQQIELSLVQ